MDRIQRYHWTQHGMTTRAVNGIEWVKATELAALRGEHETKLALIERLHKEEIVFLEAQQGNGEPALMHGESAHLIGEPCMIHRAFYSSMIRLIDIAADCDVQLGVTHSMRRLNQKLVGAVIEAAARSNHHAGSAVDMNPVYQGIWYTNEMMKDWDNLPAPIQVFLRRVMNDEFLRWGGAFGVNKDRVHIDSNLVLRDPAEWQRRVKELNA